MYIVHHIINGRGRPRGSNTKKTLHVPSTGLHTIFFLLGGRKMDLFAPQGAIKCTLWHASSKNICYVPQPRKLVFPLQLRVKECCIFRYRGIQCGNWTAHAHIVLLWNAIFFLFFFFSLLLRTALAPYWQSLIHLNCACVY